MRVWKWAALVVTGSVVLALGSCISNILPLLANYALPLVVDAITGALTGTTSGSTT